MTSISHALALADAVKRKLNDPKEREAHQAHTPDEIAKGRAQKKKVCTADPTVIVAHAIL
jgi:hypothetical protein